MSSVVGYVGKRPGRNIIFQALQRLEYRGYDCAGFACLSSDDKHIRYAKATGNLQNVHNQGAARNIDGHVGIGHLRLVTHSFCTEDSIHPLFDSDKSVAIAYNGVIENNHLLCQQLETNELCVIADLLSLVLRSHKTARMALIDMIHRLEGAYALVAFLQDEPGRLIIVRKSSPLYVGIGDGEIMVASGLAAFEGFTTKVGFLPDESIALIEPDAIQLFDFSGKSKQMHVQEISHENQLFEKSGYDHYMLKEIYEQKKAIYDTLEFLKKMGADIWGHMGISGEQIREVEHFHLVGSGTSWHAARIAHFFIEQIAKIPVQVSLSSEFCCMPLLQQSHIIFMLLSQSGETVDTLSALRLIREMNIPTIGLTNEPSSTLVREADGFLLTNAGNERAVASTKSFTTQLVALYWFAHRIALEQKVIDESVMEAAEADILIAAELLENGIENYKIDIEKQLAKQYAQYRSIMLLGRHISFPFALEAALKLKKVSYMPVECYPAGELKHGPLAGIDDTCAVFLFSHQDQNIYQKLLSNAQEIKARGGHIVSFAFEDQVELQNLSDTTFVTPQIKPLLAPLAMAGIMQFFVYHIAKELNCPIDSPRNIIKACDY